MKKVVDYIKNKIKKQKSKWHLYFYYHNQLIKKVNVPENEQPFGNFYVISVYGKKHLLGTNKKVTIVAKPMLLKYTDTDKRNVHIEIELCEGVKAYE